MILLIAGCTKGTLESGLRTAWQTGRSDPVNHPRIWSQKLQRRGDRPRRSKPPTSNPGEPGIVRGSSQERQNPSNSPSMGRTHSRSPPSNRDTHSFTTPKAGVSIIGPGSIITKGKVSFEDEIHVASGVRVKQESQNTNWPSASGRIHHPSPPGWPADRISAQVEALGKKTTIGVTAGSGAAGHITFIVPGKEPEHIPILEGDSIQETRRSDTGKVWGYGTVTREGGVSAKSRDDE